MKVDCDTYPDDDFENLLAEYPNNGGINNSFFI